MLGKRIREILNNKGMSVGEFAELCEEQEGLPVETVKNVCYGKTPDPKVSTAIKMGRVLGYSVNCLMGQCSHTQEEKEILLRYRACGTHGKSVIHLIAKYESGSAKTERESYNKHKIPCLIPKGDIRDGIVYDECETTEIYTTEKQAYTAIQMTNNDLSPIYCKGDIILIEDRFPHHNEKAAFFRGNKAYIRQYIEEDGQYRLRCLHGHSKDIILKRMDEIDYIGTCIGVVRT